MLSTAKWYQAMYRLHTRLKRIQHFVWASGAVALLSAADLSLKWIMSIVIMSPPHRIPVLPFFDLVLVFNRGISFGLLSDLGIWGPRILSSATACIIGILFFWLWRARRKNEVVGIILILGGAVGNLIDRIHDDAVTDFISLFVDQYHWPVFNGADVFITVGVLYLLLLNSNSDQNLSSNNHVGQGQKEHINSENLEKKRWPL